MQFLISTCNPQFSTLLPLLHLPSCVCAHHLDTMHLLALSEGTKTDWFLFTPDSVVSSFETSGLSPTTKSPTDILAILRTVSDRVGGPSVASSIWFYGAGVGTPARQAEIRSLIDATFSSPSITVLADLDATGRAFYGTAAAGLFCILGTGSACCYFDGGRVTARAGGHGYLFGDEAGSVDLGRAVVKAALDGKLGDAAVADLKAQFRGDVGSAAEQDDSDVDLLDVRNAIYTARSATQRLAQLSDFVKRRVDEGCEETTAIVRERFGAFFETIVAPMVREKGGSSVHVTGSVAAAFEGMVREAASRYDLQIGRLIERSGPDLVRWHQESMAHGQGSG